MPRKTKKKRRTKKSKIGVRLTDAQKARRLKMLAEHGQKTSPKPWTGQRCADALKIKLGTWTAWKQTQTKKAGGRKKASRPRKVKAGSVDGLQGLISTVQEIQKDRDRLRKALERVQGILEGV